MKLIYPLLEICTPACFFILLALAVPVLSLNATITQAPAAKSNNTLYNATIFMQPSNFANGTSYNATINFATSFGNNTEPLLGSVLLLSLNFLDMQQHNTNQTLSVIVKNEFSLPVTNVTVNGTVIAPNGTQTQINFTETSTGNYTKNFTFDQIGNWTIAATAAKPGFNNATGAKSIHVGLIEFVSFTGIDVFQSTTAFFDLGLRNKGSVSSTVVPFLVIYDSSGGVVFSVQGLSSTVAAGQNISLFQHNILTWSVGSTAAGTYNATAYLRFTDTTNNTVQAPNRTFLFQVKAISTSGSVAGGSSSGGSSGGGGTKIVIIQSPNQSVENLPVEEFIQFINIPILVEAYPGYQTSQHITMFNPTDVDINDIKLSITGIPADWVFTDKNSLNLLYQDADTIFVQFRIPNNAQPGNYQGTFSFANAKYLRDFAFILRINQVLPGQAVLVSKEAVLQEVAERTEFVIYIKNKDKFLESLRVTEKIDKDIAGHVSEVEFSTPPTKVLQDDPLVQWTFKNILPNGERNITYRVRKTINTTKPFIYTSIEEIESVETTNQTAPIFVNIYDILAILPVMLLFIAVIMYRMHKSSARQSMQEARRLSRRLAASRHVAKRKRRRRR